MITKEQMEKIEKTVGGFKVKDVRYNHVIGKYLGMVADPLWKRPGRPFITCTWNKDGKCINQNRSELDLI